MDKYEGEPSLKDVFLNTIFEAMPNCDELGGPDAQGYIEIMEAIAERATENANNCRNRMNLQFKCFRCEIFHTIEKSFFIEQQKWVVVNCAGINWVIPVGWPNNATPICEESEPEAYAEIAIGGRDIDEPADPNDCPECARSYGPHYTGECEH